MRFSRLSLLPLALIAAAACHDDGVVGEHPTAAGWRAVRQRRSRRRPGRHPDGRPGGMVGELGGEQHRVLRASVPWRHDPLADGSEGAAHSRVPDRLQPRRDDDDPARHDDHDRGEQERHADARRQPRRGRQGELRHDRRQPWCRAVDAGRDARGECKQHRSDAEHCGCVHHGDDDQPAARHADVRDDRAALGVSIRVASYWLTSRSRRRRRATIPRSGRLPRLPALRRMA